MQTVHTKAGTIMIPTQFSYLFEAPPMPDYPRKTRKGPVAKIRMTTKTKLKGDLLCAEDQGLRSRIDPAKYLGSNVSITDSLTSSLRLNSSNKPSDALLQELTVSQNQFPSSPEQVNSPRQAKNRALGTRRSATAPLISANGRRVVLSRDSSSRPNSTGSGLLPTISSQSKKKLHSYEINGEFDADATIVDADAVLDQGSELVLKDLDQSYTSYPRPVTPPVPSADVLSRRQLKLIGTNTDTTSTISNNTASVDKVLSQLIISEEAPPGSGEQKITPSDLFDMVGTVGERMLVNRARLLLLQHCSDYANDGNNMLNHPKPPTAPCGMARPSPLPSMLTIDSRTTVTERATTAPPIRTSGRKQIIRSSKLRSSSGCATWSVPCKSESRSRGAKLREPFTVQSISLANHRAEYPAPPPTESSGSTLISQRSASLKSEPELPFAELQTTPYFERCANYRDPLKDARGYTPLAEEGSLSETPLLQPTFSSLSSFLPSTPDLVK
ncbi:uncharacterized protein LOC134824950 isoform X3 [Bolinopsis microptera]|uniref:uncharacterized protein LOC134824950 isoform X3 n=1 Tax=Bolinopsis microptera TaxID=2820187 RepID=UPI003079559F